MVLGAACRLQTTKNCLVHLRRADARTATGKIQHRILKSDLEQAITVKDQ